MVVFTAMIAVISYLDGLFLIRYAGDRDWSAYLYPLIPDGLILICSIRLHEAAPERPGWAMGGVVAGVVLTLAMNVGAGVLHNWMYALADGVVPVVFFVALEVVRGSIGDREPPPLQPPGEPGRDEPEPVVPRVPEAILIELIRSGTRQEIGDLIGISKSSVQRLYARLTRAVPVVPEEARRVQFAEDCRPGTADPAGADQGPVPAGVNGHPHG